MNKRIKTILVSIISLLVLAIIILPKIFSSDKKLPGIQPGNRENISVPVKAHIVKYESLNSRVLTTGTILANEEVELRSEVAGKIVKILFKEGSYVNKGDLLIKIYDSDLQAQLRKAESKVKLSEQKEFRQRQLRNANLISQEEYDNTVNELNINKADYDLINAQIEKTEIRAPFSGVIGLRSVSEGSYVTSSIIMATLQNLNSIKIDFSIPERYSTSVKAGDDLEFRISGSLKVFTARIYAIEPKIDPATRTLKIRATCSPEYRELIPGAFANVELKLKEIKDATIIPTVAIVPELKGQRVYVYRSGVAIPQSVELGIREETRVQVVSGLTQGDTVITSGILQIRPKSKVKISQFN